jgi:hypothetical protein
VSYYKGKCQETFLAVEGALLGSQYEPRAEIVAALRAVVRFATNEVDADYDAIRLMLDDAIEEHRATTYEDEP